MSVHEKMTAIADAIRAKTGGTVPLTLDDMVAAIAGISGGENETEVITLASGFSNAEIAYRTFLNFADESAKATTFVRKTEGTFQNVCLQVFVNIAGNDKANTVIRLRDNLLGAVPANGVYDAIANAGDEYYKVVLG